MTQKSPLLNFRIKCDSPEPATNSSCKYDVISGLWKNSSGQPVIEKYMVNNIASLDDKTTITATRESIDRSEGSNLAVDEKDLRFSGETLITETREGADRSEGNNSSYAGDESLLLESIETATREGIDRAESSYYFMADEEHPNKVKASGAIDETLITRSREGTDSSESASTCAYNEPSFETTQTFTRESIDRSESSH